MTSTNAGYLLADAAAAQPWLVSLPTDAGTAAPEPSTAAPQGFQSPRLHELLLLLLTAAAGSSGAGCKLLLAMRTGLLLVLLALA